MALGGLGFGLLMFLVFMLLFGFLVWGVPLKKKSEQAS